MMSYRNSKVLVTGGLGFIGSNLAIRLASLGARVTIVDSMVPGCGANLHNIAPVREQVRLVPRAMCDAAEFGDELADSEAVFNLAGEISHVHSMDFPERDLQINTVAQLQFLTACARFAPGVRVVYASTRQVYGAPEYLPVDEEHPIRPLDFNGIHKYAATTYHLLMTRAGKIDAIALRLTNVYGPRMALNVPCQGFLSTFLRRILLGQELEIFGDGRQLRDPMFVDDCVEAFLLAGAVEQPVSRIYNVGGAEALEVSRIAQLAAQAGGGAAIVYRPFPESRKGIDIGSYTTDFSRIAKELGWQPSVRFEDGIARTLAYYRENLASYLDPANPEPACQMPEHNGARRRLTYAPA